MTTKGAGAQDAANEPTIVIYGRDDSGKAHASWFGAADAELATKAAGLMGMIALPVTTPECRALALQAARGRIHASGLAFAPFVKTVAYEALKALGGEPPQPAPKPAVAINDAAVEPVPHSSVPTTWSEISAGGLVLAPEGDGAWYLAVISEAKSEDLLILRWRDWPEESPIVRRREDLALVRIAMEEAA